MATKLSKSKEPTEMGRAFVQAVAVKTTLQAKGCIQGLKLNHTYFGNNPKVNEDKKGGIKEVYIPNYFTTEAEKN